MVGFSINVLLSINVLFTNPILILLPESMSLRSNLQSVTLKSKATIGLVETPWRFREVVKPTTLNTFFSTLIWLKFANNETATSVGENCNPLILM